MQRWGADGESANLTVDRVQYSFQVYALDTLFNRVPNWTEIRRVSELAGATDPCGALEDVFWALLNSREFIFIH